MFTPERVFLDSEEQTDVDAPPRFRPPSTWMAPKCGDPALKTYIRRFRVDIQQQLEANQPK